MAYGRSKLLAEQAVQQAHSSGAIETVIIRPCWFYGPGQPARQTRLFRMIRGGRPVIFGTGENLRSMSYVDNVVQGLMLAGKHPTASGKIYWVADERPYTTLEIYECIAQLLHVAKLRPRRVPGLICASLRIADRMLQVTGRYQSEVHVGGEMNLDIACSIQKAQTELGYSPTISLEDGMRRSIDWCRAQGIDI
jgi:nucleoside-diphosphate-sugar epimerase